MLDDTPLCTVSIVTKNHPDNTPIRFRKHYYCFQYHRLTTLLCRKNLCTSYPSCKKRPREPESRTYSPLILSQTIPIGNTQKPFFQHHRSQIAHMGTVPSFDTPHGIRPHNHTRYGSTTWVHRHTANRSTVLIHNDTVYRAIHRYTVYDTAKKSSHRETVHTGTEYTNVLKICIEESYTK